MIIKTTLQSARIDRIIRERKFKLSNSEEQVLHRLKREFLPNAEASALTWAPDGRTDFAYDEPFASALVEALSDKVIQMLAEVNITFEKTPGMQVHKLKATFPVVTS